MYRGTHSLLLPFLLILSTKPFFPPSIFLHPRGVVIPHFVHNLKGFLQQQLHFVAVLAALGHVLRLPHGLGDQVFSVEIRDLWERWVGGWVGG